MTQLTIGLMAAQSESKFAAAYQAGAHKSTYWEHTCETVERARARAPRSLFFPPARRPAPRPDVLGR